MRLKRASSFTQRPYRVNSSYHESITRKVSMVSMTEIGGAISAIKAAKNIAEAMIGLRDAAAFQEKRIELQSKILDAQSGMLAAQDERSALVERIRQLEKQVADLEAREREKQRYRLKDFGSGTFAYTLKAEAAEGEPLHHACAKCYKEGHVTILQFRHRDVMSQ